MKRIAVVGSRNWTDEQAVKNLIKLLEDKTVLFLTGDCRSGVDNFVRYHASGKVEVFFADWEAHGKAAGPIRNEHLVSKADMAFVFMHPPSKGSQNVVELCKKKGVPCFVYSIPNEIPDAQMQLSDS